MQIQTVSPTRWGVTPVVTQGKEKISDAVYCLGLKLHLPGFEPPPTFFERFVMQAPKAIEYLPDIWSILNASQELVGHYARTVPSVIRIVIATFGVLNLPLAPMMLVNALSSLWTLTHMSASRGFAGLTEAAIRVVYFGTLSSVFTAVGSHGLVEFFTRFQVSTDRLHRVMQSVFPWVGAALRISMIPQLMDISSGMRANARLSHVLKPFTWKEQITCILPIVRVHGNFNGTPFKVLTNVLYARAVNAMGTVRLYERVCRKVFSADAHFGETVRKIEGRMNSWILPISWVGSIQAMNLAKKLNARTVVHVHNQMLGFSANCMAIMCIISATNIAAVACFSILSSLFYIAQTAHRQKLLE